MKRRSALPACTVFTCLLTLSAPAAPSGLPVSGPTNTDILLALNAEVGPAFKAGQWEKVLDLGKRAYAAGGGADALETIAVAALRLGHVTLAFGAYDAIVADRGAPPKTVVRAQNQLKALKSQVASIAVTTMPEGAAVEIRGMSAGTTPLTEPLRAFPGRVEIVAVFKDGQRVTRFVDAKVGTTVRLELVGPAAEAPVQVGSTVPPVVPPALSVPSTMVSPPEPVVAVPPPPPKDPESAAAPQPVSVAVPSTRPSPPAPFPSEVAG